MSFAKILKEDNCLYLTQDISGLDTYDRAKAIVSFCDKETKRFEKEIDTLILEVFERNGINIPSTEKKVLKLAFDLLKAKGKDIEIKDLYEYKGEIIDTDTYKIVKKTKNGFTVMLEIDRVCGIETQTLQCGVQVKEKKL